MAYKERLEPLTDSDKKQVRKNIIGAGIFAAFSIGLCTVVAYNMDMTLSGVMLYFLVGFMVLFFGVIVFIAGSAVLDLRSGYKTIITGTITDKERYQHRTRNSKGHSKNSQPRYILHFDDKKVTVQYNHFSQVHVGDEIDLHYAKRSGLSLSVDILNNGTEKTVAGADEALSLQDKIKQISQEKASVEKKEYPLTKEDLKALRKYRNGKLITNFIFLILFCFFALAFLIPMAASKWFIIPEIFFIGGIFLCFRWIVKCISKYFKDKSMGMKIVAISQVKDKQISSGNGKQQYRISSAYGTYPVDKPVYDALKIGDSVFSFHGKHSDWLIGMHTEKSGYIPG
ncbi:hypothetical protein [Reichenbachiella sp. MALMAid0571]|uniref:hypothetical protein n=1 Tax=Reichenbachiella sp. MALMAid0571 TaxID=3143939 RepID=UPI0032DECB24